MLLFNFMFEGCVVKLMRRWRYGWDSTKWSFYPRL